MKLMLPRIAELKTGAGNFIARLGKYAIGICWIEKECQKECYKFALHFTVVKD